MAKANKTTKTTKATTTAKKAPKAEPMTYPQAKALTNALFHSNNTKAALSAMIDQLPKSDDHKPMDAAKKAKWLEEHGSEPATYGQCKAFAFGMLNSGASHEEASKLIADLDKKSGYVRQPKVEETVKKANEQASEQRAEQGSLIEEADSKDVAKA